MTGHKLDAEAISKQFPALQKFQGFTFGDNAGGSQIVQASIDRINDYLINTNVQMGSDYLIASTQRCTTDAQESAAELFNAASPDEIVFGASSTQNLDNLARAVEDDFKEGDELIVTGEHEGRYCLSCL
jgi:selenocysteine lyase/cysteine desulfurase